MLQTEFIDRSAKLHHSKFDYSDVFYKNIHTKVTIRCPVHGQFLQKPLNHLRGLGCHKCWKARQFLTTEQFIQRAKNIHGLHYDYSLVEYIDSHKKVKIICPLHGAFLQTPNAHTSGRQGCKKCVRPAGEYRQGDFDANPSLREQQAIVYLVKITINNNTYNKVGITKRSLKKRFAGVLYHPLLVIKTTLYKAWKVERTLLKKFEKERFQEALNFSGWSEIIMADETVLTEAMQRIADKLLSD